MHGRTIETIRINGGRLALSFVNTAAYGADGAGHDFLTGFADLVTWARRAAAVDRPAADQILRLADASPGKANGALRDLKALRAALRTLFLGDTDTDGKSAALEVLNVALAESLMGRLGLTDEEAIRLSPPADVYAWLAGPVALSAAELLTSPDLRRVKTCPGEDCHWLFLDLSRTANRRWCSMESCGNRAKSRAHYARHRAKTPLAAPGPSSTRAS